MYEDYFGLSKKPFSIVPDPRFFYQSAGHREAIAHLLYGLNNEGGFVLLTGDVGTGKTTACRRLLEHLPENLEVAFILNPKLTVEELLTAICDEYRIAIPEGPVSNWLLVSRINDYLLEVHARGGRAVLILEEAQNLATDVLEQIRLLTNLETNECKLLQVVMIGQPELCRTLEQPQFLQLSQRVTARYHLGPLSKEEIPQYINARLSVAGVEHNRLFPPSTLKRLYRLSSGVPRLINVICDRALLGAFVEGKDRVDKRTLARAAREVSGRLGLQRRRLLTYGFWTLLCLFLLLLLGNGYYLFRSSTLPWVWSQPVSQTVDPKPEKIIKVQETLRKPDNLAAGATKKMAFEALFREWGKGYKPGNFCEQAQTQGLRCLEGKGSLISLRQMNKPAVLTLNDPGKGEYSALLTGLEKETATLVIGRDRKTVDNQELIRCWTGDFSLLWHPPQGYSKDLKPGEGGPLVPWLEKQLTLARGEAVSAGPKGIYEGAMVDQIKKFQITMGLTPDGIAGPRTILPLTALGDNKDPLLFKGKGAM